MAKRKAETATTSATGARAKSPALVSTQRAALAAVEGKRALTDLVLKLAEQHGAAEHKALKRADVERGTRRSIEELVTTLALRAQERRTGHLSELGGWPACWPDERREKVGVEELLTTSIAVSADAVTCARCKKAADLPTPEETAAFHRAELGQAKAVATSGKAKRTPKAKELRPRAERTRRQLALKQPLAVRLKVKGLEVTGTVDLDGSLKVRGVSYASPHVAANELAGKLVAYRIDGFQAWRYQDDHGKWRMLRDHP